MKNIAKCALLALTVALCVVGAQAQSTVMLKANVPFSFTAAGNSHPAGEYTVKNISQDASRDIEGWFGPDGHCFIVRTQPKDAGGKPGEYLLVFRGNGEGYQLSEVWSDGNIYETQPSPADQKLARNQKHQTVAVLMTSAR